ncbi:DUF2076 domain-containing protein [Neorhizobium sp. JUb45]|uniref:DUF2076 domain-containing protein n=1 Tax=unclassified Neorhizobium TaxID=2629175 RepID=UPI001042EB92|nr:DUF2076 domain-containing protein [Neorhizobium sp. JUb45]TCR06812.1 hypothetical protein EDF70_101773 [Neorhizobium sp. JUb45]
MSPEERQLLTALFDRIQTASSTPRDRDAETLIDEQTRRQPYATYYLAQAVIVQEKGLEAASHRIQELEARVAELENAASSPRQGSSGGFLGSIFGSSEQPTQSATRPDRIPAPSSAYAGNPGYDNNDYRPPQPTGGPWGGGQSFGAQTSAPSAGGSFLRGALGTAAGVAGGMLLANSLSSVFSNHVSGLGWGSPAESATAASSGPVEETVINNYYGDSASKDDNQQTSGNDQDDGNAQQADYNDDDNGASDYGDDDFGGSDDSLDV